MGPNTGIKHAVNALLYLSVLALVGCSSATGQDGIGAANGIKCTEPRPEMCTKQYMPVCGYRENGSRKTYGNDCTACADHSVSYYLTYPCPD